MNFISKKNSRRIQICLISNYLQQFLILSTLFCFFYLLFNYTTQSNPEQRSNKFIFLDQQLSKEFQQTNSIEKFISFIENNIHDRFIKNRQPNNQYFQLVGALRIYQHYIVLPENCDLQKFKYTDQCNPRQSSKLNSFIPNKIKDNVHPSYCIEQNCKEFEKQQLSISLKSPHFPNQSSINVFLIDLSFENSTQLLQKLKKIRNNQWLSVNNTRTLGMNMLIYDTQSKQTRSYEYIISNWYGKFLPSMENKVVDLYENTSSMLMILSIYLVSLSIFTMKVILTCSLNQKPSQILGLTLIICEIFFCIIYFTEITYKSSQELQHLPQALKNNEIENKDYYDSSIPLLFQSLRTILSSIIILFIPIRFFQLLLHFQYFQIGVQFANTIYRTFMFVGKITCILLVAIISFSLAYTISLDQIDPQFKNPFRSFLSFFLYDFSLINNSNTFQQRSEMMPNIYIFYIMMLYLLRLICILILIAVITSTLKQSNFLVYNQRTPFQKQSLSTIQDIQRSIEVFHKSTIQQIIEKDIQESDKLIIWLNQQIYSQKQIQQLYQETQEKNITIIEFQEIKDILIYIQHIFQLKPSYFYNSQYTFRIVIDFSIKQSLQQQQIQFQKEIYFKYQMETLFQCLKEKGASIPVLLTKNNDTPFSEHDYNRFANNYNCIHYYNTFEHTRLFFLMYHIDSLQYEDENNQDQQQLQQQQDSNLSLEQNEIYDSKQLHQPIYQNLYNPNQKNNNLNNSNASQQNNNNNDINNNNNFIQQPQQQYGPSSSLPLMQPNLQKQSSNTSNEQTTLMQLNSQNSNQTKQALISSNQNTQSQTNQINTNTNLQQQPLLNTNSNFQDISSRSNFQTEDIFLD